MTGGNTLHEVKSSGHLTLTSQMADYIAWATAATGRTFTLWVVPGVTMSANLQRAVAQGQAAGWLVVNTIP